MMRTLLIATLLAGVLAAPADAGPVKRHAAKPAAKSAAVRARPAARPNWLRTVVRTPDGGVRMGNPAAPLALIEYGSRSCPHCAHFDAEGVPALEAKYVATGQVSYEFRDFPVHGAIDMGAILLGHCVAPARFFPVLHQMMASQRSLLDKPDIPAADQEKLRAMPSIKIVAWLADYYGYVGLVTAQGLAPAQARVCLNDEAALKAIAARTDAAVTRYAIEATPTFVLNGKTLVKTADWATLEPALLAAGAH